MEKESMYQTARQFALNTVLVLSLAGCGTLLNSNPQKVMITSGPAGASVKVNGEQKGVTPLELLLTTDTSHEVVVEAPGYPAEKRVVERSLSTGYIVGDIFMAVVPLFIDIYTNSLHILDPDELHFHFEPVKVVETPAPAPNSGFQLNIGMKPLGKQEQNKGAGDGAAVGGSSQFHCCVNGAYYDCPDMAAVNRCAPPGLAKCMMDCNMMDGNCPEGCLNKYPIDPSKCTRQSGNDGKCK